MFMKKGKSPGILLTVAALLFLLAALPAGPGAKAHAADTAGWSPVIENLPADRQHLIHLGGGKFLCTDLSKTYLLDPGNGTWSELFDVAYRPESNPAYSTVYIVFSETRTRL